MSDKKISELQEVTVLDHNKDYVLAARDEDNYKIKVGNIIKESRIGIPTKLSQLINDMKYISTIPDEYITKAELDIKGYLTEQDLADYAKKSDINTVVSQIVDSEGYITESELDAKNYLTEQDLTNYALKTDIPTVPTKVSELINDSGYMTEIPEDYATKDYVDDKVANIDIDDATTNLTGYAKLTDIPTNVSAFNNDKGYITSIPSEYITESELLGYDYATESYVNTKITEAGLGDENYGVDLSSYVTEDELAAMGYTTLDEASATFATNETVLDLKNGLETNYSTTTQMNSAIQQSASNITSTVSSTYATKDELNGLSNTYVTQTEFDQTNEDFTFKIQQSGGGNLLRNSDFYDVLNEKYDYWTFWGNCYQYTDIWLLYESFVDAMIIDNQSTSTEGGFYQEIFGIKPNVEYTLSVNLGWADNVISAYAAVEYYSADGTRLGSIIPDDVENNIDTRQAFTFTTPADCDRVRVVFNHNGSTDGSSAFYIIQRPCLVEGYGTVWTPHSKELYDGIVKIDKNGLIVKHGDNKTVLDSEAFKFYEGDIPKSRVDGGVFKFTDADGVELGQVGCGTWAYDRTKAISVLKATYGHSVALSAPYSSTATTSSVGIVHSSHEHWVSDDMVLYQGINMSQPIICGMMNFKPQWGTTMQDYDGSKYGHLTLWGRTDDANGYEGYVAGNNYLGLGVLAGNVAKTGLGIYEDSTQTNGVAIHGYGPLNMHGFSITNSTSTMSLNAQSQYTNSLLSTGTNENISYGTLSYDDNEIRWCWKENVFTYQDCDVDPETDEWVYYDRYVCYIELPIFMAENIEADYHINVSKMSWGDWRIREKNQYYFILESEENDFAFTFEVVAKLKDGSTIDTNSYIANSSVEGINGITPEEFVDLEIPTNNNESLTS